MSKPTSATLWTPEQEQAITVSGQNILVGAAAGSGKTATLVERVIRRLTDPLAPVDVDQLLVVTFTEAAAAEMRERIGLALQQALAADPENSRLQRQIALLGRASISTLHAYCLGLIRQYFYRLGLDPAVSVMSEHEALLLRHDVLDELFGRRYQEDPDGPFYALVDRYGGGRDDEGLRDLILTLYDFMQSLPWPAQWLAEAQSRFDLDAAVTVEELDWWPHLRRQIRLELTRAHEALVQAERLCRLPGAPLAYEPLLAREASDVGAALTAIGWNGIATSVQSLSFDRLPAVRKGTVDEGLQERIKALREEAKKAVKGLMESYFQRPAADWLADLRAVAPHLQTLGDVVTQFTADFAEAKAAQSSIDFTDLEQFTLKLLLAPESPPDTLIPSDVATELRSRYAEVLVDEYQDINGVQDAILTLSANDGSDAPPNRFMVGDVKQSIYRFRHGDPTLFLDKYHSYQPWTGRPGTIAPGATAGASHATPFNPTSPGARIILGANFRSRAGVVDGVNFLFRQLMTPAVGEIAYGPEAELVCQAAYPLLPDQPPDANPSGPPVELHLLDQQNAADGAPTFGAQAGSDGSVSDEEPTEAEELAEGGRAKHGPTAPELADLPTVEREARLVAQRIQELVGTAGQPPLQVWDRHAGEYRPVRYRDIVILMRATSGRANTYLEVLSRAGVPAYAQLATGYFAATEIEIVLSLLQLLDNPRQEIPLGAVLRSPIIGLSNNDLARIRLISPNSSFYDALRIAAREAEPLSEAVFTTEAGSLDGVDLVQVIGRFLGWLERWRTLIRRRPLSQVLWQIFQETGYLHYVAGMPGGAQRQANLLALYDRARQFDQFARQGLFRFLRFIERLRAEEADMGAAPAIGEAEDVVRLMSIHKSKGLEFPVVFVTSLGGQFARQDRTGDLLLQRSLGFGPQLVDPELRIKYPTLAHHAIKEAGRLEALAEELRVLYVALTRARERLILVGSTRDLSARCIRWAPATAVTGWPLPESMLLAATSYLDWLGPALVRHGSGESLRAAAGLSGSADARVMADASQWMIRQWDPAAQQSLLTVAERSSVRLPLDWQQIGLARPLDLAQIQAAPLDPAFGEPLRYRFDWQYPYEQLVRRYGKLSVTELKGHFDPDAEQPSEQVPRQRTGSLERTPRFLQESRRTLTPTEYGTLMHLVLQHLDLTRPLDEADLTAQVSDLVTAELLTPEQAEAVAMAPIVHFFASGLGQRIRRGANQVRRELSFTLALPAADAYPDLDPNLVQGEAVIVQGMIDLLLQEEDGYVLVDYKTDRREPEAASERYGRQIELYRRAVQEIMGRPVTEAYLHFLASDHTVKVEG